MRGISVLGVRVARSLWTYVLSNPLPFHSPGTAGPGARASTRAQSDLCDLEVTTSDAHLV